MDNELKKKILDDIHKTGFVSELLLGSKLIKAGWEVTHNASYFDKDFGKSREIDIVAFTGRSDKKNMLHVGLHVAVEVKSSKRPWVVFAVHETPWDEDSLEPGWRIMHVMDNLTTNQLWYSDLMAAYMRAGCERVGTVFYEAFKSPSEPSQIYEAVISACKAAVAQRDLYASKRDDNEYDPTDGHSVNFIIPLVILDGELCEAHLNSKGEMELESRNFVPIRFDYSSSKYAEGDGGEQRFYPDIITLAGIDDYLERVDRWLERICSGTSHHLEKEYQQPLSRDESDGNLHSSF